MLALYLRIQNWLREQEEGQDMVEYVLLIVLIALIVAVAIPTVTDAIEGAFGDVAAEMGATT